MKHSVVPANASDPGFISHQAKITHHASRSQLPPQARLAPPRRRQTALTPPWPLHRPRLAGKYGCEMIGRAAEAIERGEIDRFSGPDEVLSGWLCDLRTAHTLEEARSSRRDLALCPLIIRPPSPAASRRGGLAYNRINLEESVQARLFRLCRKFAPGIVARLGRGRGGHLDKAINCVIHLFPRELRSQGGHTRFHYVRPEPNAH